MNQTSNTQFPAALDPMSTELPDSAQINPQTALLGLIFPGSSLYLSAVAKFLNIDINRYFPLLVAFGVAVYFSRYIGKLVSDFADGYLMSTADIRIDDEMYNMLMSWVANQQFSKKSRRFVANTNLNSKDFLLWITAGRDEEEEEDDLEVDFDENSNPISTLKKSKQKKVRYTPSYGVHYFWYKNRVLMFRRGEGVATNPWQNASDREEIRISAFGRNPAIIKELLDECRQEFLKNDINRTIIYRGGLKSGTAEPCWTRCVSRVSRPFSTVVLDEEVKAALLADMRDYLHPNTRRWYSNRGIPYRRGYLCYGPPGTGKTSLCFATAGYFKLPIYIVSLNSPAMNEENLSTLFSELPKQCVVLLEDIDTAGLTHSRDDKTQNSEEAAPVAALPGVSPSLANNPNNRISLSGLLNVLDGVASHEGRVLIMTTNHREKLDEALIRPGRVDMSIEFSLANTQMMTTIFRSIFATLEGDCLSSATPVGVTIRPSIKPASELTPIQVKLLAEEKAAEATAALALKKIEEAKVEKLGEDFATLIPTLTFSPAEIQGYLLKHKRDPEGAVRGASAWAEKTKAEKNKKATEEKEKEDKERLEKERAEGWNLTNLWG
ncbi:hypothetical protein IFR05_011195 [Cadophora sp. M221]|nr:hypothetical protein IFR05_011195 [Cadophora sp. M221]